jgi:hypothetical protein
MTEQEISENEQAWAEERGDAEIAQPDAANPRSVGISPGGVSADIDALGPDAPVGQPAAGGAPEGVGPGAAAGVNAVSPAL